MTAQLPAAGGGCPPEERLYAVLASEAAHADAAHVAACGKCQAELRRLQEETTVLQQPHTAVAFHPATVAPAPGAIGKYIIVGHWDEAPGWTTYRGLHAVVHREVLVQVARQPLEGDAAAAALAAASRRWMTRQPHVALVLDVGVFQQRPFLVVEYPGGVRLDRIDPDDRTPDLAAAFGLLAAALAARSQSPHLYLRPASLVWAEDGRLILIDWAAASLWGELHSAAQPTSTTAHGLAALIDRVIPRSQQLPEAAGLLQRILSGQAANSPGLAELAAAFAAKKGGIWRRWLGG